MKGNRLELCAMFFGAAVIPSCGAALIAAGVAGAVSIETSAFFGLLAVVGTILAISEIRKGVDARSTQVAIETAKAEAKVRAQVEQDRIERENRPTWRERIAMSEAAYQGSRMRIHMDAKRIRRAA